MANAAEIITGEFAKEVFWPSGKVGNAKMGLRLDFLCLSLPEILQSPFFSLLSETAEIKWIPFLLDLR